MPYVIANFMICKNTVCGGFNIALSAVTYLEEGNYFTKTSATVPYTKFVVDHKPSMEQDLTLCKCKEQCPV